MWCDAAAPSPAWRLQMHHYTKTLSISLLRPVPRSATLHIFMLRVHHGFRRRRAYVQEERCKGVLQGFPIKGVCQRLIGHLSVQPGFQVRRDPVAWSQCHTGSNHVGVAA